MSFLLTTTDSRTCSRKVFGSASCFLIQAYQLLRRSSSLNAVGHFSAIFGIVSIMFFKSATTASSPLLSMRSSTIYLACCSSKIASSSQLAKLSNCPPIAPSTNPSMKLAAFWASLSGCTATGSFSLARIC